VRIAQTGRTRYGHENCVDTRQGEDLMADVGTAITWWTVATAFGGTVVGSTISVLTSYLLQRKALNAAKAQRDEDRFEVRKALAYSLWVKMIRLCSDLHNMGKEVRGALDRAKEQGFSGAPFQVVRPIVPIPDSIRFSPDELAVVLSVDAGLFNEMGALDELHSSTMALFELYGTKRNAALERLGTDMQGNSNIGTTYLTAEQKNWLEPRAFELNSLVEVMLQRTEQDGTQAWIALEHLRNDGAGVST
jgi:hypothetical protein